MQVYILAAGKSSRMAVYSEMAKPLLKLNGTSILGYLIKMVARHPKTKEINLIVGYKKEIFQETFGNSYENIPIKYHFNLEYASSDNLYTLYMAKDSMKNDIVFMTADLIIDPKLVEEFLDEEPGNKVLVDTGKDMIHDDVVKVRTKDSKIVDMCKKLSPKMSHGVAVGLYRLDGVGKKFYFEAAEKLFSSHGKDVWIIDIIPELFKTCPFYSSDHPGYVWFDVDEPDDLVRAKKEILKLYRSISVENGSLL